MNYTLKSRFLVKHSLISTIQEFKNGFFIWMLSISLASAPGILTVFFALFGLSTNNYFVIIFLLARPLEYCFLNLAFVYHATNQFSLKSYFIILRRLPSLILVAMIEGISLRIVPFNELFMGFFVISFIAGNSIWQSFKQSCSLSKRFPLFPITFFCIESIRIIINFVLPRFLFAIKFTSYYRLFGVFALWIIWVLIAEIFFLLFKINAYSNVIQK